MQQVHPGARQPFEGITGWLRASRSTKSFRTQQGHGASALPSQPPHPEAFLYKAAASATAHGWWERRDFASAWENPLNVPQQHPPSGGRTHRSAAGLVKCFPASLLKQTQSANEPQNAWRPPLLHSQHISHPSSLTAPCCSKEHDRRQAVLVQLQQRSKSHREHGSCCCRGSDYI